MWGTYVEGQIEKVRAATKDPKQAEQMIQMKLRMILREEEQSAEPKDSASQGR